MEKSPEEIRQEAAQIVDGREAEARKAREKAKRQNPLQAARDAEVTKEFTKLARKERLSFQGREAKLRSKFMSDEKQKEREQERDSRFGSR